MHASHRRRGGRDDELERHCEGDRTRRPYWAHGDGRPHLRQQLIELESTRRMAHAREAASRPCSAVPGARSGHPDAPPHRPERLTSRAAMPETTREQLMPAGRVTGVNRPEHLLASHCNPWRDSDGAGRWPGESPTKFRRERWACRWVGSSRSGRSQAVSGGIWSFTGRRCFWRPFAGARLALFRAPSTFDATVPHLRTGTRPPHLSSQPPTLTAPPRQSCNPANDVCGTRRRARRRQP